MPQAVAVAANWIAAAVFSATGSIAAAQVAVVAVSAAATIGTTLAVNSLASAVAGKSKVGGESGTQVEFKADPSAGIPYAVGETGVAGNIVFANTGGAKNVVAAYLSVQSLGPVEEIVGFKANAQALTFSGDNAVEAPYHDFMNERRQLGDTTPAVFNPPAVTLPEWTSAHKLTGYAAQWWALAYDKSGKVYPTGLPKPLSILKGVKVYDPRLDSTYPGGSGAHRVDDEDTWEYSEDPFLNALAWALGRYRNGKRILGLGAAADYIDLAAFVEGAGVCDANGWKIGGVVYSTDDKWQVFQTMLAAGGGYAVALGAKISCGVCTPRVSLDTLTGDDAVGEVKISAVAPKRDRYNAVIPAYRSADHDYQMVPAEKIEFSTYLTEDGGDEHTLPAEFLLVPDVDQAAQLGCYAVANSRELGPIVIPCKPRWMGYPPNSCITVDEPEYGLNGQKCLIVGRDRNWATGIVTLTLVSETDAKHAACLAATGVAPPTPSLTGIDARFIDEPGGAAFTATGATLSSATGDIPAIVVEGDSDNEYAADLIVRYKVSGGDWAYKIASLRTDDPVRVEITSVTPGTAYDVECAYRSGRGVTSEFTSLGTETAGSLIAEGIDGQTAWATFPDAGNNDPYYVEGQIQYLDFNGRVTDATALPLNTSIGFGGARAAWPMTSTSSSISVPSGYTEYRTGTNISVPSGTASGLSADTIYDVFYFPAGPSIIAIVSSGSAAYMIDPQNYVYLGRQATKTGGGTYSTPPASPGGALGGGSIDYQVVEQ